MKLFHKKFFSLTYISLLISSLVIIVAPISVSASTYIYTYTSGGKNGQTEQYPTLELCTQQKEDNLKMGINGSCAESATPATGFYCYQSATDPEEQASNQIGTRTSCFAASNATQCETARAADSRAIGTGCYHSDTDVSGVKTINNPAANQTNVTQGSKSNNYVSLSKITLGDKVIRTDLAGFIIDGFQIAVAGSAALAIIMIILGGVQYMSTDAISGKHDGRTRIEQALLGLFLVMISFLVLKTINPKIVDLSILTKDTQNVPISNIQYGFGLSQHVGSISIVSTDFFGDMETCKCYESYYRGNGVNGCSNNELNSAVSVTRSCQQYVSDNLYNYVATFTYNTLGGNPKSETVTNPYEQLCEDELNNNKASFENVGRQYNKDLKFTIVQNCTKTKIAQ